MLHLHRAVQRDSPFVHRDLTTRSRRRHNMAQCRSHPTPSRLGLGRRQCGVVRQATDPASLLQPVLLLVFLVRLVRYYAVVVSGWQEASLVLDVDGPVVLCLAQPMGYCGSLGAGAGLQEIGGVGASAVCVLPPRRWPSILVV